MTKETLSDGNTYERCVTADPAIVILKKCCNREGRAVFTGIKPGMLVSFKKTPDIFRAVTSYDPATETVYCWKRDRDNDNMLTPETTFGPLSNIECVYNTQGEIVYGSDC